MSHSLSGSERDETILAGGGGGEGGIAVSTPVQAPAQLARTGWICIDLVAGESGWALIREVLLQSSTLIAQGVSGVANRCQGGDLGETAQLRQQIDAL